MRERGIIFMHFPVGHSGKPRLNLSFQYKYLCEAPARTSSHLQVKQEKSQFCKNASVTTSDILTSVTPSDILTSVTRSDILTSVTTSNILIWRSAGYLLTPAVVCIKFK